MTFHKLLIANRGEIACRIIKTAHEMGISCVAVYTEADSNSPFVRMADQAVKLSDTYLNGKEIIDAAIKTGAEAIHQAMASCLKMLSSVEMYRRLT